MEKSIEIFTLITGVIYVILEIRQKNFMWVLGILTSLAAMWMFFVKGAYASFGLNTYYLVTSFIGLWHWRKDAAAISQVSSEPKEDMIRLRPLTLKVVILSLLIIGAGTVALSWGMDWLYCQGVLRENPMSFLDALVTSMSAVATWWLVRSYLEQWWLWILADTLSTILCMAYGMWWMAALYAVYAISAVIGLRYWKKHGVNI